MGSVFKHEKVLVEAIGELRRHAYFCRRRARTQRVLCGAGFEEAVLVTTNEHEAAQSDRVADALEQELRA